MLCLRCSVDIATVDDVSRMVISARPCGLWGWLAEEEGTELPGSHIQHQPCIWEASPAP